MQRIKQVFGPEPRRDGEYPEQFYVGYGEVHRIETEEQNLGTYGITWFVAIREDDSIVGKMNAAHVASIYYFKEGE